jgi:hypothetical protein
VIGRATASDPVSGEVGGDDSGEHDPVEHAGASDADNTGGNLYDTAKMKMIRDESGRRIGAGKAFALDEGPV